MKGFFFTFTFKITSMKQLFLKAKHWQLFIAAIGLPIIMVMIMLMSIFNLISNNPMKEPEPENLTILFFMIPFVVIIGNFTHFFWMYTMSTELQKYQSPMTRAFKVRRFKTFFIFPIVYMIFLSIFIGYIVHSITSRTEPNFIFIALAGILVFFLHLLSIFAIIYTMYFTAKTITSVEMKKETHFSDYIGDFFLIWFFPVGIWFLQPRINRLLEEQNFTEYEELLDN